MYLLLIFFCNLYKLRYDENDFACLKTMGLDVIRMVCAFDMLAQYKLEFQIEKTGSKPILQVGFTGSRDGSWNDLATRSDVKVTGAVKGNNFEVKSETVTLTVSEKLSSLIESSNGLSLNGQQIIIKSVKVVE